MGNPIPTDFNGNLRYAFCAHALQTGMLVEGVK